jgi:hypothetical protein
MKVDEDFYGNMNHVIIALYEEYLWEPLGHRSHELLHTCYAARKKDSN